MSASKVGDVLPGSDTLLESFATNFSATWVPATFGVTLPLAADITGQTAAFSSSMLDMANPAVKSAGKVATKNQRRELLKATLRVAISGAQRAYLSGNVAADLLIALGIVPNSLVRTPIAAPVFGPLVSIDSAFPGLISFRLTQVDQMTGLGVTTRRFDYGIVGCEVERRVGAGGFMKRFDVKRVLFDDSVADLSVGAIADYRVRYVTSKGLVSPWSAIVSGARL